MRLTMAMVEKSVLIERSAQQMFDLVDDVEDYPGFLPWCSRSRVDFRDEQRTVATLHVHYRSVKTHFTTENEKEIPLRMRIKLSYEFSSKMFEKVIGPVFSQIANTFVDAFVKRADQCYGVLNA